MKHKDHRHTSDPAPENEREHQRRELQEDQSGRIRHYLDLAERLLRSDHDRQAESDAAD